MLSPDIKYLGEPSEEIVERHFIFFQVFNRISHSSFWEQYGRIESDQVRQKNEAISEWIKSLKCGIEIWVVIEPLKVQQTNEEEILFHELISNGFAVRVISWIDLTLWKKSEGVDSCEGLRNTRQRKSHDQWGPEEHIVVIEIQEDDSEVL
jgi:hypothetical protein